MPTSIALIAHDNKKDDMVAFAHQHQETLSRFHLIATGTTGERIQTGTGLAVERFNSGPVGGDTEIAARVVVGEVAAVVFLIDPLYSQPHEPDIRALLRVCEVHDVPLATNLATAHLVMQGLSKRRIAHLIFNPVSGTGNPDQDLALIRQLLEPQIQLNVLFTKPDVDPIELAQEAVAKLQSSQSTEDIDTGFIIASGGDGTVSAVASAVVETDIPLGVIPRGTANAFAVALGIPTNLRAACETIAAGNTRVIDTARCNDTPMILLAGLGFEAGMVDKADRDLKRRLGSLAYVLAGAQQLAEQQAFDAEIEIDGKVSQVTTGAITIANVAPPTSVLAQGFGEVIPDDGLLEVTIATSSNRFQGLNALASLFTSALVKAQIKREDIVCLRTNRLRISTDPQQDLVIDGEIIQANPIVFECIPQGLTVLAPLASM